MIHNSLIACNEEKQYHLIANINNNNNIVTKIMIFFFLDDYIFAVLHFPTTVKKLLLLFPVIWLQYFDITVFQWSAWKVLFHNKKT